MTSPCPLTRSARLARLARTDRVKRRLAALVCGAALLATSNSAMAAHVITQVVDFGNLSTVFSTLLTAGSASDRARRGSRR